MKGLNYLRFLMLLFIAGIFIVCLKENRSDVNFGHEWKTAKNKTVLTQNLNRLDDKQRGAHVFGRIGDSTNFEYLKRINIEWATLVSWGFQKNCNSSVMTHHDGDSSNMLYHDSIWVNEIKLMRSAGFKVFFKPHIWIDEPADGKWRSDIFPTNDDNWQLWKKSYRDFIIRYAKVAERANAEMYCIGTEFTKLTTEKPIFWQNLIREVRKVYSGKITYAANWYKEYEQITFWRELDYIGVQAYFPLTRNKYPTERQISKGWKKYLSKMKSLHKKYNRKILFTEMGYKSTADSAIKPWVWMNDPFSLTKDFSIETQVNCYQAFFNTVWDEKWFEGVHIWSLRSDYKEGRDKRNNLDFTPQGKPAEDVIRKGFE